MAFFSLWHGICNIWGKLTTMRREDIQNMLSVLGYSETLNKEITGANKCHMMHVSGKLRRLVEYYADRVGLVKLIWGFADDDIFLFENMEDFRDWLNK